MRSRLSQLSEPEIAGLLYLALWKEKRRKRMFGPPFVVDEAAARSQAKLLIPDGWIDLKFIYSFSDEQSFFGIECKRLQSSNRRLVAEYVKEGVMRFVDGKYSPGHDWAAMCGFIIEGRVQHCAKILESEMETWKDKTRQMHPWRPITTFGKKRLFCSVHKQQPKGNSISLLHVLLSCSPTKRHGQL